MKYDDTVDFKVNCNSSEYFKLFEPYIPKLKLGSMVLLYAISNVDCLKNIIDKNQDCVYYIYDTAAIFDVLKLINENNNVILVNDISEINMKFDCIIMNPPYQRNLHLKILAEAIKHLKDDGTCVNLSPDNWLMKHNVNNPIGEYRKMFNGILTNIDVICHDYMNMLFNTGNSIEEGCITVYSKDKSKPHIDIEQYGFNSIIEKSLYSKVSKFKDGVISIHRVVGASAKGCYGKSDKPYSVGIYGWHGGKTCKDTVICENNKKPYITLFFNSENEKHNFLNSLDTVFMNWYCKAFIEPGNFIIKNHFFIMSDYSQPWDDARFYKFFNITPEEQKVIEETMKKYS